MGRGYIKSLSVNVYTAITVTGKTYSWAQVYNIYNLEEVAVSERNP